LSDNLKRLSKTRKAAPTVKPKFILNIVDEAIGHLASAVKAGAEISFLPMPRSSNGRTALRVSASAHRAAQKASEVADVRLADFVRTALSLYIRRHASEINQETKTARHRGRK